MIEQPKFTCSPLGKALRKQIKETENQSKKQIKPTEELGKQLIESNGLIKNDFNINRDAVPFLKKFLMNF